MEKYRDLGLKLTPQRLAILKYLEGNKEHPSAEDIYRSVARRFPSISLATVYNTVATLHDKGKLKELTIDPDKKRFEPNVEPHHHLICVHCKKIVDVHGSFHLDLSEGDRKDFEILGNHIEFYGICPKCRA